MAKFYIKSLKEYNNSSEFNERQILSAMKKVVGRRKPTSVALEEKTIKDLKKLASKIEVPYQVLMRMFQI